MVSLRNGIHCNFGVDVGRVNVIVLFTPTDSQTDSFSPSTRGDWSIDVAVPSGVPDDDAGAGSRVLQWYGAYRRPGDALCCAGEWRLPSYKLSVTWRRSAVGYYGDVVVVEQVMLKESVYLAISTYGTMSFLGGVVSMLLPIETKGREMMVMNLFIFCQQVVRKCEYLEQQ